MATPPQTPRSYNSVLDLQGAGALQSWIVQKYGGTSVGKFPEQIVDDIVKVYSQEHRVAVVCLARSSHTKLEGTTLRLLQLADLAEKGGDFEKLLRIIGTDHINNAKVRVNDQQLQLKLISDTLAELDHAKELLHACQVIGEILPRTLDHIMLIGEKLLCLFMAALMNDRGVPAQYVDCLDVIPLDYDFSHGFDDKFYQFLAVELGKKALKVPQNCVPVLTGYFGVVPGGLLNGVGRGYTDLCAALVAVGVQGDELQIWKEVDGIFTADPRKVPNARLLELVTPEEAAELTYYGLEVIHPSTMEQVIKAKIPIRIKNVENPKGQGTVIYPDNVGRRGEATPPHPPTALEQLLPKFLKNMRKKRSATAITAKLDIVVVNIHSNKKTLSHGFLAHIFTTLDRFKLVVDLISTSEVHVSMALLILLDCEDKLKEAIKELRRMGTVDVTRDMAIISLVGKQMVNFIGIAGNMFKVLADERINIEMISQGANEINISAVINLKDVLLALVLIHARLLEGTYEELLELGLAVDLRLQALKLG